MHMNCDFIIVESSMGKRKSKQSRPADGDLVSQLLTALQKHQDPLLCLTCEIAVPVKAIPTFQQDTVRHPSPMLEARFRFGSTCQVGCDTWLGADEMKLWMSNPEVMTYHDSLRRLWTNSAPMLYPDEQLSLFGRTEDVPDSLIYLVWGTNVEPEIWSYSGTQQIRYPNLVAYLRWCLT